MAAMQLRVPSSLLLVLVVLFLAVLPSSSPFVVAGVTSGGGGGGTGVPPPPPGCALSAFQQQLQAAECTLKEAANTLCAQQVELKALTEAAACLDNDYNAIERQLSALLCSLHDSGCSSSKQCNGTEVCLLSKVAELEALLHTISCQLSTIQADICCLCQSIAEQEARIAAAYALIQQIVCILQEWEAATRCGQQPLCEQVAAWECALTAKFHCLCDLLEQIAAAQCCIAKALGELQACVAAVRCLLQQAESLWCEVKAQYLALLQCWEEAKELAFLDWAQLQLSHLVCEEQEALKVLAQQKCALLQLQQELLAQARVVEALACAVKKLSAELGECKVGGACSASAIDAVTHLSGDLAKLLQLLEAALDAIECKLQSAYHLICAQEARLASVAKLICQVQALIDQWRASLTTCEEGGKVTGQVEQAQQTREAGWRKDILEGLAAIRTQLACICEAQQPIWALLDAVKCALANVDGCGLVSICPATATITLAGVVAFRAA